METTAETTQNTQSLGSDIAVTPLWSRSLSPPYSLQWRHNEHDGVSNHQPHDCSLNRLFRRRSKKTSKLRVTGLCEGNSPVTGEFPAQRASNAENVSIWWRHHVQKMEKANYIHVLIIRFIREWCFMQFSLILLDLPVSFSSSLISIKYPLITPS